MMKTLKESILDADFDSHVEDVCQIPMGVLATSLEGYGHPLVLKKYLKGIRNECMFDQIWEALSKSCYGEQSDIKEFSPYELGVVKKFIEQNPVDSQTVKDTAKKKIFAPLEDQRVMHGYDPLDVDDDVAVFFDPIRNANFYNGVSEFYFFIDEKEAGWIAIKKGASKEHIDLLKCILR